MPQQDNTIVLTKDGLEELQAELKQLQEVKLPESIERVARARDHGDLSENAEYHSARDDKQLIETRIEQILEILEKAQVVASTHSHLVVGMGSQVTIVKKDSKKSQIVTLVGEFEADPINGKISVASPMGKSLLKKKKGEVVTVEAPAGKLEYTITDIK